MYDPPIPFDKCPLDLDIRAWIERRWAWPIEKFGLSHLQSATVVLPTAEFFPDKYEGNEEGARAVFDRVCNYVGLDPDEVELGFFSDRNPVHDERGLQNTTTGLYQKHDGKYRIWSDVSNLNDPLSLVATFARELCHVHLLGHGRISEEADDEGPLAELLTVFLGFGIINANAVLRELRTKISVNLAWWQLSRQGYLNMPMYAYALARFARDRGEQQPRWAKHLRPDVLADFRKVMDYFEGPVTPIPASLASVLWSNVNPSAVRNESETRAKDALEKEPDPIDPFADADCSSESRAARLREQYMAGERSFVDGDYQRMSLKGIDLQDGNLRNSDLSDCDLSAAMLDNTNLRSADLTRCNLRGAKLRNANLQGADFYRADLTDADLTGADIRKTNFTRALLEHTTLTGTIRCSQTDFSNVDLRTVVCDVDLSRESLLGVENSSPIASGVGVSGRIWFYCVLFMTMLLGGGLLAGIADGVLQMAGVGRSFSERAGLVFGGCCALALAAWVMWPRRKKKT